MSNIVKLLIAEEGGGNAIRIAVTFVLLVLLASSAAQLTWRAWPPAELPQPVVSSMQVQRAVKKEAPVALAAVWKQKEYHLFGEAGRKVAPLLPEEVPREAPKTTLNLVLKGVLAATPEERALAFINEKGGKEEDGVYSIGERVPGNAVIKEIHADRVILSRGGKYETLMMTESEASSFTRVNTPANYEPGEGIVSLGDGQHWNISQGVFREKLANIPALAKEIGVAVYRQGKEQKGYRLTSAKGSGLLKDLGLQAGDILFEVNGIALTDASQGLEAYQNLKNSTEINMVIQRRGRRMNRVYSIE